MKKKGELPGGSAPAKKTKAPKKEQSELLELLQTEDKRLRNRIAALENLEEVLRGSKDGQKLKAAIITECDNCSDRLTAIADALATFGDAP